MSKPGVDAKFWLAVITVGTPGGISGEFVGVVPIAVLLSFVGVKSASASSTWATKSLEGLLSASEFIVPKLTVFDFEINKDIALAFAVGAASPLGLTKTVAPIKLALPFGISNSVQSKRTSPAVKTPVCCLDAVIVGFISTVKYLLIIFYFFTFSSDLPPK